MEQEKRCVRLFPLLGILAAVAVGALWAAANSQENAIKEQGFSANKKGALEALSIKAIAEPAKAKADLAKADGAKDASVMSDEEQQMQQIEMLLNSLTLEEKVAQMFFVTPEELTGARTVTETDEAAKAALDTYPVGGLVFFSHNLLTPEQTKAMLYDVQQYALQTQGVPLFLGVDEEGGRVLRIGAKKAFGVEKVKAMGSIAAKQGIEGVYCAADTIGGYLKELGFNVDFAPDADVITNASNRVIGDRSFGTDPETVADMAWRYSEGLHDNQILACYKHFPGHGGTVEDSHSGYAYSYKNLEELKEAELVPFQQGCGKGVDFIMASHISAPNVTGSDVPASLSELFVTDILRNEMGYQGIVITDSLSMGAVCSHYSPEEAAVLAVQAGCDMLLMPQDFERAYQAVIDAVSSQRITQQRIDESVARILKAKQYLPLV